MNKNKTKITVENKEFLVRPWDFEKDHEEVTKLLDIVFADMLQKKGLDIKFVFEQHKRMLPFLKFLGIFDKNFKHPLDGFVIENEDGKIIASVNVGYAMDKRYEIAMVATHPDYRRKGFARKLVNLAVDHAKKLGAEMCILEVLDINEPAYKLYKSLGFVHYDSITRQKLEPRELLNTKIINLPERFKLEELRSNKKINLKRYELDKRITPEEVQNFQPVRRSKYHKPLIIRIIRPLAKAIIKPKSKQWVVFEENKLVGTLNINIGRKEDNPHRIEMMIDSEYSKELTEAILTFGLKYIKENKDLDQNTIIEFRTSEEEQRLVCEKNNFETVETMHLLGLKFES